MPATTTVPATAGATPMTARNIANHESSAALAYRTNRPRCATSCWKGADRWSAAQSGASELIVETFRPALD